MNKIRRQLHRRPRSRRAGFTLIEVLVASIIFAFITLASSFALSTALHSQAALRETADMVQEVRGISTILASDIRCAYASENNPNTLFISGGSAPGALVTFTTLNGAIQVDPQEEGQGQTTVVRPQSDLRTVTYAHDPSSGVLTRVESPVPGTDAAAIAGNTAGMPQTIISRRVVNIAFEFYDAENQAVRQDWAYTTDPNLTQGATSTDTSLPQSVHVELEIAGRDGRIEHHTLVFELATPTPAPAGQAPPTTTTTTGTGTGTGSNNNGGLPGLNGMGGLP